MKPVLDIKPYSVVTVTWSDSTFVRGWHYPPYEDVQAPLRAKTAALVFDNCEEYLTVAEALTSVGGALNPLLLPWPSIEAISVRHDEGLWRVGLRSGDSVNWLDVRFGTRELAAQYAAAQDFEAPVVYGVQMVEEKCA